jgi:two-component system chemotaxis sensor kinase CheA
MNEIVREFLLETNENLAQLDLDLVTLEKDPTESETLARVFRAMHTVKGTAGFLGLMKLQAVGHAAENLLSMLRAGELTFNAEIASGLLRAVDAIRRMLDCVERTEQDGDEDHSTLIQSLEHLRKGQPSRSPTPPAFPPIQVTVPANNAGMDQTIVLSKLPSLAPASLLSNRPGDATIVLPPQAAAPEPPSHEPAEQRASAVSDSSIRVDVGLLDQLMNLVGELVLARNQIMQFSTSQEQAAFLGPVQRLNVLTTELQVGVMKTRMQPIGNIWSKFPRLVRDLAVACNKQVRLNMEGRETELDKTIIEAIRDPLTHMVRNSIDHGIETPEQRVARGKPAEGRLTLHAFHERGKVIIKLDDDGGGIDPQRVRDKAIQAKVIAPELAARMSERELINLIFLPGFSTTDKVTQFSGRGVGMDVVRTNIEKIGGSVDIDSRLGRGTTIQMKIPLTLAIIPALTVTSGGDRYAIPQVSLLELVRLEGEQAQTGIEQIHGAPVYRLRGNLLPLIYLDQQLQVDSSLPGPHHSDVINIVVLQADDRSFGLIVDDIHDTEEIVVKPLQKQLKGISAFAGATIMGDGTVALILDVLGLAQRANVLSGVRERALSEKTGELAEQAGDRQTILLCDIANGGRLGIPLSQVARLEEFPRSSVETVGAQEVVQYRNEILPLIDLSTLLSRRERSARNTRAARAEKRTNASTAADTIQVVVYAGKKQWVGLVVHQIHDIVEDTILSRTSAKRPGVLFTAVVQGRVTEFLDIEGIIRSADSDYFEGLDDEGTENPGNAPKEATRVLT